MIYNATTAEPIQIPFVRLAYVSPRNHVIVRRKVTERLKTTDKSILKN